MTPLGFTHPPPYRLAFDLSRQAGRFCTLSEMPVTSNAKCNSNESPLATGSGGFTLFGRQAEWMATLVSNLGVMWVAPVLELRRVL
jgi:hypothetical protein